MCKPLKAALAVIVLLSVWPHAASAQTFTGRPLTLPIDTFQPVGLFEWYGDRGGGRYIFGVGLDVGVFNRTSVGVLARLSDGYDQIGANIQHSFGESIALRFDFGLDHFAPDQSFRLIAGLGVPIRLRLASNVALISGRPWAFTFTNDPSLIASDDILTLRIDGYGMMSLGIPVGLLVQISGDIALDLRSGYRHVFGFRGVGDVDLVPLGADLLVNLADVIDLGIGFDIAGPTGDYLSRHTFRVWIQGRF